MGWGTEDAVGVEGQEDGEAVVVVKASFLLVVAWQFRSMNISLSSIVNSAHVVEAEFALSKILLIFWVTQGPAEPPFMYERTNKMLLCSSVNSAYLMLR